MIVTYQFFADKQTYFENHHGKTFLPRKNYCVCSFSILSCCAFNSAFAANIASFVLNRKFLTRAEILVSLICVLHLFYLGMKGVNCKFIKIRSSVIICSTLPVLVLRREVAARQQTWGILLSALLIFVLKIAVLAKLLMSRILFSISLFFSPKFCLSVLYLFAWCRVKGFEVLFSNHLLLYLSTLFSNL